MIFTLFLGQYRMFTFSPPLTRINENDSHLGYAMRYMKPIRTKNKSYWTNVLKLICNLKNNILVNNQLKYQKRLAPTLTILGEMNPGGSLGSRGSDFGSKPYRPVTHKHNLKFYFKGYTKNV